MSNRINGACLAIGCLVALAVFSACASGRSNLVENNRLRIETEAPEEITISVKGVYEEDEIVGIKGVVWWQSGSPDELYSAHLDIEVLSSDGTASTATGVELRRIFLHRAHRQRARFSALVETFVREDSTIRVIFHHCPHDGPAGGKDHPAPAAREGT